MRRITLLATIVASGFACGGGSGTVSGTDTFTAADMKQTNEPPALHARPAPNATGTAVVTIAGNTLNYSLRGTSLTSQPTVSHIHLINPNGGQGPVVVTFKVLNTGATASATSITVDDTVANPPDANAKDLSGNPLTFDALVQLIRDGKTYVNIHTQQNTGGEIRADLKPQ